MLCNKNTRTIDDVKRVRFASIVADQRAAVVRDDSRECVRGPRARSDPAGKLVIPYAVVSAEKLVVRLGEIKDDVSIGECEGTL